MSLEWVPEACTLPTAEQPFRVAEFDQLFRDGLRGVERVDDTRLRLRLLPAVEGRARELTARETSCCSFFGFDYTTAGDVVLLDVTVPAAQAKVLDALAARYAG